jgi:hypothetical protein
LSCASSAEGEGPSDKIEAIKVLPSFVNARPYFCVVFLAT